MRLLCEDWSHLTRCKEMQCKTPAPPEARHPQASPRRRVGRQGVGTGNAGQGGPGPLPALTNLSDPRPAPPHRAPPDRGRARPGQSQASPWPPRPARAGVTHDFRFHLWDHHEDEVASCRGRRPGEARRGGLGPRQPLSASGQPATSLTPGPPGSEQPWLRATPGARQRGRRGIEAKEGQEGGRGETSGGDERREDG